MFASHPRKFAMFSSVFWAAGKAFSERKRKWGECGLWPFPFDTYF